MRGGGDLSGGECWDPGWGAGFLWGGTASVIPIGEKEMKVGGGTGKYAGFVAKS